MKILTFTKAWGIIHIHTFFISLARRLDHPPFVKTFRKLRILVDFWKKGFIHISINAIPLNIAREKFDFSCEKLFCCTSSGHTRTDDLQCITVNYIHPSGIRNSLFMSHMHLINNHLVDLCIVQLVYQR